MSPVPPAPEEPSRASSQPSPRTLNRSELARQSGVDPFIVDLVIGAGLLTPVGPGDADGSPAATRHAYRAGASAGAYAGDRADVGDRFESDAVDMLAAARTFVSEGVAVEELAALAMRHAANVEAVIDDAIDLFKRHADRQGRDRSELVDTVQRLVGVATQLVAGHFERTLVARALSRLGSAPSRSAAGAVVVVVRRLDERVDPLAVYAAADSDQPRSVWLQPSAGLSMASVGVAEAIEPSGLDRFSNASAARAMLQARVRRYGPDDAPAPVLTGGFSFVPSDTRTGAGGSGDSDGSDGGRPVGRLGDSEVWASFGDCRLVLAETTVIDRPDGTWLQAAARVGLDGDEAAVRAELEQRLASFDTDLLPASATARDSIGSHASVGSAYDADEDYLGLAAAGVDAIAQGGFRKVVLARTVTRDVDLVRSARAMPEVLGRLRDSNPSCAIFAFAAGDTVFFGATPEVLVTLDGDRLRTTALAGTAARGATAAEDEELASGLQASAKNLLEHRFVVEGITEALAGLGLVDAAPDEPGLMRLARLQHLSTLITARVQRRRSGMSDMDVLRVAGVLHPTPAVGGTPTGAALEFISEREGFDRGWYAGPVGWCDLDGNGELRVALRSGLAEPGRVRLFAGAGIVADSIPAAELDETNVKLLTMLDVLDDAGSHSAD